MKNEPIVSEDVLTRMKACGMSDENIAHVLGCASTTVKKLRHRWNIPGLTPNFRSPKNGRPTASEMYDGWPEVMPPAERDRHWNAYFLKMGRDHSDGEVRFRRTGVLRMRPDRSHLHALGASSLEF
jgi:hypothetical protein